MATNVWGVEQAPISKGMPDSADVHVPGGGTKKPKGKLRKTKKGCVVTG